MDEDDFRSSREVKRRSKPLKKTKEKKGSSSGTGRERREKLDEGASAVDAEAQKYEKEQGG